MPFQRDAWLLLSRRSRWRFPGSNITSWLPSNQARPPCGLVFPPRAGCRRRRPRPARITVKTWCDAKPAPLNAGCARLRIAMGAVCRSSYPCRHSGDGAARATRFRVGPDAWRCTRALDDSSPQRARWNSLGSAGVEGSGERVAREVFPSTGASRRDVSVCAATGEEKKAGEEGESRIVPRSGAHLATLLGVFPTRIITRPTSAVRAGARVESRSEANPQPARRVF